MAVHELRIAPLPIWLDAARLLGPAGPAPDGADGADGSHGWRLELQSDGTLEACARLPRERAADLAARLRGLGFDGRALACEIQPPLRRAHVRRARTDD
ncbi:hypothetical protein, partial [Enhygromyxa salina]|uniref:hypothetical protein n=1 Tax=Enhygromyxa salina TaxID=215803 RepID=UPI0011BA7623